MRFQEPEFASQEELDWLSKAWRRSFEVYYKATCPRLDYNELSILGRILHQKLDEPDLAKRRQELAWLMHDFWRWRQDDRQNSWAGPSVEGFWKAFYNVVIYRAQQQQLIDKKKKEEEREELTRTEPPAEFRELLRRLSRSCSLEENDDSRAPKPDEDNSNHDAKGSVKEKVLEDVDTGKQLKIPKCNG